MFTKSKGQSIRYKGEILVLIDHFPVDDGAMVQLTFEHFGSPWKQGIALRTNGSFEIGSQTVWNGIVLWQDTAPRVTQLRVKTMSGFIEVNNMWDVGDGCVHSWHNGAAMIVEDIATGRRYRCNDGHPDDNFDDIVFRLEIA